MKLNTKKTINLLIALSMTSLFCSCSNANNYHEIVEVSSSSEVEDTVITVASEVSKAVLSESITNIEEIIVPVESTTAFEEENVETSICKTESTETTTTIESITTEEAVETINEMIAYEELNEDTTDNFDECEKDAEENIELIVVEEIPSHAIRASIDGQVNFRNEPNTSSYIISVLNSNTKLYVIDDLNLQNDFYTCVCDNYIGYVHKSSVHLDTLELYAKEDTKVMLGGERRKVLKDTKLNLYKTYGGEYLYSKNLKVLTEYSDLVTKSEYIASKLEKAKYEKVTSFSTNYSLAKLYEGKAYNINHCCEYIDGMVIMSGDEFNWFKNIGNTGKNEGYVLANVFANGGVTKGYGGGVCQVASTMYNCVLNLDLKVIERHPHGQPVYYVDYYAKKDASVSDISGGFNFIWKNTTDYDIMIKAYTDTNMENTVDKQGVLTIEFYKIVY